jgi:F-type H+-transporting ATPase subunit gamma
MRPYAVKLKEILTNLSATLDLSENAYSEDREAGKTLIVGITSNRGLCGGFNNNIVKSIKETISTEFNNSDDVHVLCLGKKIRDAYKRSERFYTNEYLTAREDVYADLTFDNISEVATELMELYKSGAFNRIYVVYNRFVNAATQKVETEQFLPIQAPESETENPATGDYIFEPSKEEIIEDLIPKSLKVQLFKAILDSNAAEHGARMTAMHKATDNASDLQKELKLSYNKARQAAITNEILEIVGGAEALNA